MGNRTPLCQCDRCLRIFSNRNDLRRHRKEKGHVTRMMWQSRYIKHQTEKTMQVSKPDSTMSIVQTKAGEVIPPTLLRKLVEENRSAVGFCVREPDKLIVEKFHKLDDVEKNFAFMTQLQEATKKFPVMWVFHALPAEFDEDEVQPFIPIKDSKGNPMVVVAAEGDFPTQISDEFSEAYVLLNEWLCPKIESMYKLVGNSPQKLFEYLHSAQFQNDFRQVFSHRGVLGFMPTVGDPFIIEHNELGITSTWGSASNAYGYTESVIAAATPTVAEVPATPAVRKSRYAEDTPGTAPPTPVVTPPQADPKPVTPVEKVAAELQPSEIDWSPPKGVHGKSLKQAYRAVNNGVLPTNWRDRPTIRIQVKKQSVKSLQELSALTGAKDMKTVTPQPTENKIATMPVISGAQQSKAVDFIKKYLGDGSGVIDDPIKAQEQEAKLAKFSELVLKSGKLEEIDRWTTAFIFAFVKENPETAALGFIEMRNTLRKLRDGGKTLSELTGTERVTETPVQPPALPVSTPVVEQPVVTRRSKYS